MADNDSAALRIAAPFVNQFQIVVAGSNVRIAFAEGFSGQATSYRSAVVMSEADARELALSILTSLPAQATGNLFASAIPTGALGDVRMTSPNRGLFGGAAPPLPAGAGALAAALAALGKKNDQ